MIAEFRAGRELILQFLLLEYLFLTVCKRGKWVVLEVMLSGLKRMVVTMPCYFPTKATCRHWSSGPYINTLHSQILLEFGIQGKSILELHYHKHNSKWLFPSFFKLTLQLSMPMTRHRSLLHSSDHVAIMTNVLHQCSSLLTMCFVRPRLTHNTFFAICCIIGRRSLSA